MNMLIAYWLAPVQIPLSSGRRHWNDHDKCCSWAIPSCHPWAHGCLGPGDYAENIKRNQC